jgi:hypothetical protein
MEQNMKLKLFRYSGEPVNKQDREAYMKEWQACYDKGAGRAALNMELLQRYLRLVEHCLVQKYNQPVTVDLPASNRAWAKLIEKYEDTPVALARTKDGKQLVLILMDQLG